MDLEQEKAALLKLYEISRQSHFESDATKFLIPYAQQWYSTRDGTVTLRTRDAAFPAIERYFQSMHFLEFDDQPPIVEVSKDGSMAWLIGEVQARAMQRQPDETEKEIAFRCSWVEIFEKQEAGWAVVVNSSHFAWDADGD